MLTTPAISFVPAFEVLAYIGPGSGLSAIGAVLALVLGLAVAFFAFFWYPIRRYRRKRRERAAANSSSPTSNPPLAS